MRRLILGILLCLLAFTPQARAGDDACVRREIAALTRSAPADIVIAAIEQAPLYVDLRGDLAVGDRVRFEMLVGGERFFTEEVELVKTPRPLAAIELSAVPVVELLSANPARLGALYRIAARQDVKVRVARNGELVGTVPFAELAAASDRLSQEAVLPFAVRSTRRQETGHRRSLQKDECTQFCDDQQNDCYLNRCGQFGSASCYDACDSQWIDCLESCGICQPSSSTSTTYSIASTTPLNVFECHTTFGSFSPKGIYRAYDRLIKRTDTTTTTNSDCTQTVTSQVSYFHTYCWVFQYPDSFCFSLGSVSLC